MDNPQTRNPTPNRPNAGASPEKFVEAFEKAVMQYVILAKAKEGGVTKESAQQIFRSSLPIRGDHLDECLQVLTSSGHLTQEGNRYAITDDGREDVEKVQHIVLELPQVVNPGGPRGANQGQTRQEIPAQRAGGGSVSGAQTGGAGASGPSGSPQGREGQNPSRNPGSR